MHKQGQTGEQMVSLEDGWVLNKRLSNWKDRKGMLGRRVDCLRARPPGPEPLASQNSSA